MSGSIARRALVVLHETGYFRMYGSTIVELAQRGWDVRIAFDNPAKRGDVPQVPAGSPASVVSAGAVPATDGGRPLARLRAAVDYLRYLEAPFSAAEYLRRRSEKHLPSAWRWLTRVKRLPVGAVSLVIHAMRAIERLTPANASVRAFVRDLAPDVVIVSPVVTLGRSGSAQTDVVKAALKLRIPVVIGIASWDHLTSKGLVRLVPDAVTVWNKAQVDEAVSLHRLPAERIVVTGAQSLDHWFEPVDTERVAAFRRSRGIEAGRQVLLFTGSSRNMAPGDSEVRFVRRWLTAVRASSDPSLAGAFVLVRPHPTNTDPWRGQTLADPAAVVYPLEYSGIPLSDDEVMTFRQSILASAAVVGVNTTAMIEGAIHLRPVLTIRDSAFDHSQGQTLHFAHLSSDSGGCALTAHDLDAHVRQLEAVVRDPRPALEAAAHFVRTFVRPCGAERAATAQLCDAIEAVAAKARRAASPASAAVMLEGRG